MKLRLLPLIMLTALFLLIYTGNALGDTRPLTILFTSDIHSYFTPTVSPVDGTLREHGGAGRLSALLSRNRDDHTILVDAGDFAMGTLLQAGYLTDAYELRLMGMLGVDVTTFGNHEFDFSCDGAAQMLRSAMASGDPLPGMLIPANLDLSGSLTGKQQSLKDALGEMGAKSYVIREIGGIRVAVFGLLGTDAISCAPTSAVTWLDPIQSAKRVVKEIGDQAEVIICVSHSGTNGDSKSGEDVELLKQVKEIDVVVSGHTHTTYHQAVLVRDSGILGSCGYFLTWLGRMDLLVDDAGKVTLKDYALIPVDENVAGDEAMDAVVDGFWQQINSGYLADTGYTANQVIAHSDFQLDEIITGEAGRGELPMGSLIADSYLYACDQAGYTDVEIAVVGQGTIRTTLQAGDITVADAFEVCSLGAGSDNSAGHPIVSCWVKGSDLKLLTEMDALIAPLMSTLKLHWAGLNVTMDLDRIPLDRVTRLELVRRDGSTEPIQSDRRYRVAANMYAVNMLASVRSMSKGLIAIDPTDIQGQPISDFYAYALRRQDGSELKEWQAFVQYLASFEQKDGVSQVPERYSAAQGRKLALRNGVTGWFSSPGIPTLAVFVLVLLILFLIVYLVMTRKQRKLRKQRKRAARAARKEH